MQDKIFDSIISTKWQNTSAITWNRFWFAVVGSQWEHRSSRTDAIPPMRSAFSFEIILSSDWSIFRAIEAVSGWFWRMNNQMKFKLSVCLSSHIVVLLLDGNEVIISSEISRRRTWLDGDLGSGIWLDEIKNTSLSVFDSKSSRPIKIFQSNFNVINKWVSLVSFHWSIQWSNLIRWKQS